MLKRMILAGLLAATALPTLASDVSSDKAALSQSSTTATASTKDSAKHDCACACHGHKA